MFRKPPRTPRAPVCVRTQVERSLPRSPLQQPLTKWPRVYSDYLSICVRSPVRARAHRNDMGQLVFCPPDIDATIMCAACMPVATHPCGIEDHFAIRVRRAAVPLVCAVHSVCCPLGRAGGHLRATVPTTYTHTHICAPHVMTAKFSDRAPAFIPHKNPQTQRTHVGNYS